MRDVPNSKELKVFVKGAFVLIGLIFILSYGVAALVIHFDKNIEINKNHEISKNNENDKKIETEKNIEINKKIEISKNLEWKAFSLILILVIFPVLVFIAFFLRFSCLMKFYHNKLYNYFCVEHDENIYRMFISMLIKLNKIEMMKELCPKVLDAIKYDKIKDEETSLKIKKIIEETLKAVDTIKPDLDKIWDDFLKKIKEIIERHFK